METGEAIVDLAAVESAHRQMSVGACVNVAARLQQLAAAGEVLVGPTCHEANAETAEFLGLGDVELKGLGRLPVWRLVALRLPRGGVRMPFVGRDAEIELLRIAYRRARSGRSVLVLVSGPPGQGKTRLVDEFITGLGAEVQVLKARCRPAGELGARSTLQELLVAGSEASADEFVGHLATQGALRPGGDRFFATLDALDEGAARSLARHAGRADARGIERAEGNPLFIIELARARSFGSVRDVPLTLQGVIGARLDELPPRDRELLQRAAVVGETFTVRDAALLSDRDPVEVAGALERLADLQYLHPVVGGQRFQHALVRDVAYGRLTTAERMPLHARYAQDGVRPDDAEALAHHLWEAVGPADADWVWEGKSEALSELRAQALQAHLAAGRRSADHLAYARAVETCRRGFRFATTAVDVARVEDAIADACAASGEADEAWIHYMRARDLHRNAGMDPPADLYPSLLEPPVYADLGEINLFVAGEVREITRELLGLAPASKILFSTDASLVPELYWLGAQAGRRALGQVLDRHIANGLIDEPTAIEMAEMILWRNAERVYRL